MEWLCDQDVEASKQESELHHRFEWKPLMYIQTSRSKYIQGSIPVKQWLWIYVPGTYQSPTSCYSRNSIKETKMHVIWWIHLQNGCHNHTFQFVSVVHLTLKWSSLALRVATLFLEPLETCFTSHHILHTQTHTHTHMRSFKAHAIITLSKHASHLIYK